MGARDDVGDDLRLRRIGHRRLEHTDDRGWSVAEADAAADDSGIALERRRPEAVGQDHGACRVRPIVRGIEQPPDERPQPHDVEVRAADHACPHPAWFADADDGEFRDREVAEGGHGLDARPQVADFGHRELGVVDVEAERTLPQVDQAILITIHERLQQHAVDDTEDRRIGADAQSQRDDDGGGETLDAAHGPNRVTKVGEEAQKPIHPRSSAQAESTTTSRASLRCRQFGKRIPCPPDASSLWRASNIVPGEDRPLPDTHGPHETTAGGAEGRELGRWRRGSPPNWCPST
jgi:hypothetical protein